MFDADQHQLTTPHYANGWNEIETALSQYDTGDASGAPCELVIAGATR